MWNVIAGLDLPGEHFIHAAVIVFLIYIGVAIGTRRGEWFEPARLIAAFNRDLPYDAFITRNNIAFLTDH